MRLIYHFFSISEKKYREKECIRRCKKHLISVRFGTVFLVLGRKWGAFIFNLLRCEKERKIESGKNTPIHKNQKPLNGRNVVCFFYGGCAFYLYKNTCKKVWCAKKRGCPSRTKVTNVKTRWSIKRKTKTDGKC